MQTLTFTTAVTTGVGEVDITVVRSRPERGRKKIKGRGVGNQFDMLLRPFTHCGERLSQSEPAE